MQCQLQHKHCWKMSSGHLFKEKQNEGMQKHIPRKFESVVVSSVVLQLAAKEQLCCELEETKTELKEEFKCYPLNGCYHSQRSQ